MGMSEIAPNTPLTSYNVRNLPPLEEMTLQEIVKYYLTTCVKSQGRPSVCMKCDTKCEYGKQAVALATGNLGPKDNRAVPYEGSLLDKARRENEFNRKVKEKIALIDKEIEEMEKVEEPKKSKKKSSRWADQEGWYEEAAASGNILAWTMNKFNLTKTQAKRKIHYYESRYVKPKKQEEKTEAPVAQEETSVKQEEVAVQVQTEKKEKMETLDDVYLAKVMERKLEGLMNQQEEYEAKLKEYQTKLNTVKEQIDTICKTMDIFKTGTA